MDTLATVAALASTRDTDPLDLKDKLWNSLEVIGKGTFATSRELPNAANPGLDVDEVGRVGLPLTDRDAVAISKVCHEAPFGKGSETKIDPSVRKTWELNPTQWRTCNPVFEQVVEDAMRKIAGELGILDGALGFESQKYKLLLYEPGAFFDVHRE